MSTEDMSPEDMAKSLRNQGWRVYAPPDLRIASSWRKPKSSNHGVAYLRSWIGSPDRDAARVYLPGIGLPVDLKHVQREYPGMFLWEVRLIGTNRTYSWKDRGAAKSVEDAQKGADTALMELLERYRKMRLANQVTPESTPASTGPLFLP